MDDGFDCGDGSCNDWATGMLFVYYLLSVLRLSSLRGRS